MFFKKAALQKFNFAKFAQLGSRQSATKSEATLKSLAEMSGPRLVLPYFGTSWLYSWFGKYRSASAKLKSPEDLLQKHGPIYREYFGKVPIVSIFEPRDIMIVMKNQGRTPIRPPNELYVSIRKKNPEIYGTVGITESNGAEWKELRDKIAPVLLFKPMKEFYGPCSPIADQFIDYLKKKENSLVKDSIQVLNLVFIEMCWLIFFGEHIGAMTDNPKEDVNKLSEMSQNIIYGMAEIAGSSLWKYIPTKTERKTQEAELYLRSIVSQILEKRRSHPKSDNPPFIPICDHFLAMGELDFRELVTLHTDFVVPSTLSLGSVFVTLLLHRLGQEAKVLQTLQNEIDEVVPCFSAELTSTTFSQMPYLNAVLKEAYRLTTIIPGNARLLPTNVEIKGYDIPAFTPILCQTRAAARNERYFSRPLEFIPERWLSKTHFKEADAEGIRLMEQARKAGPLVIPFGLGSRLCAGKVCIELQIKVLLTKLLKSFSVKSKGEVNLGHYFVVAPTHPVQLEFVERPKTKCPTTDS